MKLVVQKRLAGELLKCSSSRIVFDTERLSEIKEAITKFDIRRLIKDKAITKIKEKGVSRARANKLLAQKTKGRRKGPGSRKGKATARTPKKEAWMNRIRLQRTFLLTLKEKQHIDAKTYRNLYLKAKGGFFRSKRHIKLYLDEHNLVVKK